MHLLLTLLLPLFSHASAFEDGQKAFQGIKEIRDLVIDPIEFKYSAELAKIRAKVQEQERLKGECTTFECAQEINNQIAALKFQLKQTDNNRLEEIIQAELPFEQEARKLLLGVYYFTLKESLERNPLIKHLKDRGVGDCGKFDSATGHGVFEPLPTPHVCQQVNLDFKQGEKFVRLSLAVGTVKKHYDWTGNYAPVRGQAGLAEVERILNDPTWLAKYTALDKFTSGASEQVSYYPNGKYMLGGTSDIGLAVISREEQ